MEFITDDKHLRAVILFPVDCGLECVGCFTKQFYDTYIDVDAVLSQVKLIAESYIQTVVISGGEPGMDCALLRKMLHLLQYKNVYINTSLIESNVDEFINIINTTPCIRHVDISRYPDANNLSADGRIRDIKKSCRVNIILPQNPSHEMITSVIERWKIIDKVPVCFIADANYITPNNLQAKLDDNILQIFMERYMFVHRSYTNISEHYDFTDSTGHLISYYKQLLESYIRLSPTITLIYEIIVRPDGRLMYDYTGMDECIEDIYNMNELQRSNV